MKSICKKILMLSLAVVMVLANFTVVFADTPYRGYTYNFWGFLVPSPAAYIPTRSFGLEDFNIDNFRCDEECGFYSGNSCELETHTLGSLTDPTDLHVDSQGNIYIVDSGNDRILVFDIDLNLNRVIDGFYHDGEWDTFNKPFGVFVTENNQMYIADNQNFRVVILDEEDNYVREINEPQVEGLDDSFEFLPMHVLVDRGGRTFVIVQRVYEGIMSFNAEGEFIGYFGTIEVPFLPIEIFWRLIMSEEWVRKQNRIIAREFLSMDIDQYGFVYTTHKENNPLNNQVLRLNPRGEDVLVNYNEDVVINGDQGYRMAGAYNGPSIFVDIIARSHGMYSTLDNIRNRIYTYDSEGNLLYVFAGPGNMEGMAQRPVAIEMIGDDFLILDSDKGGRIIQYEPTHYGNLINNAIGLRYDGHEQQAVDLWMELKEIDENFALAWSGIGRSLLAAGDNVSAMEYLKHGMDVRYYSVAFRRNRVEVMQSILPNVFTVGMVAIAAYVGFNMYRKRKKKGEVEGWQQF